MNLTQSLSTRGALLAVVGAALLAGCSSVPLDSTVPVESSGTLEQIGRAHV